MERAATKISQKKRKGGIWKGWLRFDKLDWNDFVSFGEPVVFEFVTNVASREVDLRHGDRGLDVIDCLAFYEFDRRDVLCLLHPVPKQHCVVSMAGEIVQDAFRFATLVRVSKLDPK